jgi:hypothetical protein
MIASKTKKPMVSNTMFERTTNRLEMGIRLGARRATCEGSGSYLDSCTYIGQPQ